MHGTLIDPPPEARGEKLNSGEVCDLAEQLAAVESRESFWSYRNYMNLKKFKVGWFPCYLAETLQEFYVDWKAGRSPKYAILTPPQHGKSRNAVEFVSWVQGHRPDSRAMYASFSDRLGQRANLWLQRIYDSPRYKRVFPNMAINTGGAGAEAGNRFLRNLSVLEYVDHEGSFRNTTVNGKINGEGLDLGVVDDPLKGRAEANSAVHRDKAWEWFTDDFFGRFSEEAGFIITVTRWHVDDVVGRMKEHFGKDLRVVRCPAIATEDEKYRGKGEPLFPELKSLKFLLERKKVLTQSGWQSVYQQSPIVVGGGEFPIEKFGSERQRPVRSQIRNSVRYWDKAGTEGGGAFTAGVLMDELRDGTFLVSDVRRGQWGALDRETRIRQTAEIDNTGGHRVETWVEQEPGSGGKESAESTIRKLRGFVVKADRVTGKKEVRAEPYAAQVQAGNVKLLVAPWNRDFLDEHEVFPSGKYKDQVDAAGGAFMKVTAGSRFSFDNVL